jgi:hypothetical protein
MHPTIQKLRERYQLDIESPFVLKIDNESYSFQCLIKGYGNFRGMIVDVDSNKIKPLEGKLMKMGFGYSSFDIEDSDISEFNELLDDWGVSNA